MEEDAGPHVRPEEACHDVDRRPVVADGGDEVLLCRVGKEASAYAVLEGRLLRRSTHVRCPAEGVKDRQPKWTEKP